MGGERQGREEDSKPCSYRRLSRPPSWILRQERLRDPTRSLHDSRARCRALQHPRFAVLSWGGVCSATYRPTPHEFARGLARFTLARLVLCRLDIMPGGHVGTAASKRSFRSLSLFDGPVWSMICCIGFGATLDNN